MYAHMKYEWVSENVYRGIRTLQTFSMKAHAVHAPLGYTCMNRQAADKATHNSDITDIEEENRTN